MKQSIRQELIQTIENFSSKRMMVVGDLLLDQYTWGNVSRISPEAPIPVLHVDRQEFRLGGAACTAAMVRVLDCEVFPVGLIGKGLAGDQVLELFEKRGISTDGVIQDNDHVTIVKNRLLTSQQQLLRVDHENVVALTKNQEEEIIARIDQLLPEMDGVIISDYQKGVVTEAILKKLITKANELEIPIVCDPGRGADYKLYRGITTIKPNRLETALCTNIEIKDEESLLEAARIMKEECQADFLSISLDKDGILYYRDSKDYQVFKTVSQDVFDVTGAGDMVIATIGSLIAFGADPAIAIQMANVAAGLEIGKMGAVPISWKDIEHYLKENTLSQKILTLDELKKELNSFESLVFTNGYFDNLSAGHLRFLLEMSRFSGKTLVAINSDKSILKNKGKAPLFPEKDRARLLASIENVDYVVVFDEDDVSSLIEELKPAKIVKGEDFKSQTLPETEKAAIKAVGATIEYIPHFEGNN